MLKYWYLYLDTLLKKDWANSWWKIKSTPRIGPLFRMIRNCSIVRTLTFNSWFFYQKNDSKRIWFYNLLILPESCRGLIVSQNYLIILNPFWLQFPQIVLQNYKQSADVPWCQSTDYIFWIFILHNNVPILGTLILQNFVRKLIKKLI